MIEAKDLQNINYELQRDGVIGRIQFIKILKAVIFRDGSSLDLKECKTIMEDLWGFLVMYRFSDYPTMAGDDCLTHPAKDAKIHQLEARVTQLTEDLTDSNKKNIVLWSKVEAAEAKAKVSTPTWQQLEQYRDAVIKAHAAEQAEMDMVLMHREAIYPLEQASDSAGDAVRAIRDKILGKDQETNIEQKQAAKVSGAVEEIKIAMRAGLKQILDKEEARIEGEALYDGSCRASEESGA